MPGPYSAETNLGVSVTDWYQETKVIENSPYEDYRYSSPRADDHELLEPPYMLEDPYAEAAFQAPPSPDYVPGPEEPEQAPPSPDYVPGPELADDEIVAGQHIAEGAWSLRRMRCDMDIDEEDEDDEMEEEAARRRQSAHALTQ
ncbi:hypothetical protein Tco_1194784 [Tanacetum coccineum]